MNNRVPDKIVINYLLTRNRINMSDLKSASLKVLKFFNCRKFSCVYWLIVIAVRGQRLNNLYDFSLFLIDVSFSCLCPVIAHLFLQNIGKVNCNGLGSSVKQKIYFMYGHFKNSNCRFSFKWSRPKQCTALRFS